LAHLGAWTLLGVFFTTQTYSGSWYGGHPLTWRQAFVIALVAWYLRAALSPLVYLLARRFPFARRRWFSSLAVHGFASFVFTLLELAAASFILLRVFGASRAAVAPFDAHINMLTYWALVGVEHFAAYYARYRERELAASRLEAELAGAKLDLLRAQLHPHFLFNTLNGISELMHEDVEQADLMLGHLSELLRFSLEYVGRREVPLADEAEFSRRYLEVQRMRFQERLAFELEIPPSLLSANVPYLVLQPLVENAVLHGTSQISTPGRITLRASQQGGRLRIEVADNGPGLATACSREGVGLQNTRMRLEHSYGKDFRLQVENAPAGGVRVFLELPLRRPGEADGQTVSA
jgi:signal transduction histidine kinase